MKSKNIPSTKLSVMTINNSLYGLKVLNSLKNNKIHVQSLVVVKPKIKYNYKQFISVLRRIGIIDTIKLTFDRMYYFTAYYKKAKKWNNKKFIKTYSKLSENVYYTNEFNSNECINFFNTSKPDIIILAHCGIIKEKLISIPDIILNAHPGILPAYRGVDVSEWAVLKNDFENIGCTVHLVDKGVDTGDIISIKRYDFRGDENLKILNKRVENDSIILLILVVKLILKNKRISSHSQKIKGNQYYKMSLSQWKKAENNLSKYLSSIS